MPYTQIIKQIHDEDGVIYVGYYLEIPEARTHARNMNLLQERMKEVLELCIECRLNYNESIPEPMDSDEEDYSGRFTLRIPKSLHQSLTVAAKEEGVSLNQYALYKQSK